MQCLAYRGMFLCLGSISSFDLYGCSLCGSTVYLLCDLKYLDSFKWKILLALKLYMFCWSFACLQFHGRCWKRFLIFWLMNVICLLTGYAFSPIMHAFICKRFSTIELKQISARMNSSHGHNSVMDHVVSVDHQACSIRLTNQTNSGAMSL
jgi:hypothetical protein